MDNQTVRTSEQGCTRGYDGPKKVCGRKRHLLVDTLGLVLLVVITAANVQDREGARTLLTPLGGQFRRLRIIWGDGAYAGWLQDWFGAFANGARYGWKSYASRKGSVVLRQYHDAGSWSGRSPGWGDIVR